MVILLTKKVNVSFIITFELTENFGLILCSLLQLLHYILKGFCPHYSNRWWGFMFRNARGVHPYILCLNYMMFPVGLEAPPPLIWGSVLIYLRLSKNGCCSISDNLSCFHTMKHTQVIPKLPLSSIDIMKHIFVILSSGIKQNCNYLAQKKEVGSCQK